MHCAQALNAVHACRGRGGGWGSISFKERIKKLGRKMHEELIIVSDPIYGTIKRAMLISVCQLINVTF